VVTNEKVYKLVIFFNTLMKSNIERNKDKLDLKPCIDFVAKHISCYKKGLQKLLDCPVSGYSRSVADLIHFNGLDVIINPQVRPGEIKRIVSAMPESLTRLSNLANVNYFRDVIVPNYDENGNFNGNVDRVDYADFPRAQDHPSRILVGWSDGLEINLNPIPKTVSENEEAVKIYQLHVFLHEFFHTIELLRRYDLERSAVLQGSDGKRFTLQDFWDSFEKLSLSKEKKFVSRYAATYADKLNKSKKKKDSTAFVSAIGEQICESFAGYMLGIVSNDDGDVNFKKAHPKEYALIDRVCRANVLKAD